MHELGYYFGIITLTLMIVVYLNHFIFERLNKDSVETILCLIAFYNIFQLIHHVTK